MWIVAKYKPKEFASLKEGFFKVLGDMPEFYNPKIKYEKYINNKIKVFDKNILDNYLICKHSKFNHSGIVNQLKNLKGLNYFLNGYKYNQKELENFVVFCKSNENDSGFLNQSFFNITKKAKAKFISGPFTEMMFDIVESKGKKLKILLNNINITISKKSSKLLYSNI